MSTKVFKYILDFKADSQKFGQEIGGINGMLKGAAVAAGALFAADKIIDAAQAVGEYALEISNVKNEVEALTGLSGAQADAVAGGAMAIKQAYEEDVNEAIKASNILMKQFGETSGSSFDLLNAGLASAANANGDLLQQVREYSTHFREAGLDASQMFAIIAQGNKLGVFDDKAADSIKEGSIRLREMTQSTKDALNAIGLSSDQIQKEIQDGSKSMFDVMRQVSAQLQRLPEQSPAVGAALADIFGGPGEDAVEFIRTLADVDTSMQGLIDGMTESQKAQYMWSEELKEFHTIGAQVFGGTGTLVTKVKTLFMGFVNDAIRGIVDFINYFIDLYNESMVFRGAIEYIKFTFKTTFDFIGTIFKNFWNQLKGVGQLIKAVFTGDIKSIPEIIKNTFQQSIDNASEFGNNLAENFKQGVQNTLNPREKVKLISLSTEAAEAGAEDGKNYAIGFKSGAGGAISFDVQGARSLSENISKSLGDPVADVLKDWKDIQEWLNNSDESVDMSGVDEGINKWKEKTEELKEQSEAVRQAVQGSFDEMGQGIVDSLGLAETGFEGFVKGMFQTVTKLVSMMLAESLANSIAGATASGAATGPAAIFTTPAFIATAVGGVFSAFAAIPKFASGGLAYGPTMGMIGEYPGASSNPEVIAPLDKLRGMVSGGTNVTIKFLPVVGWSNRKMYLEMKEIEREESRVR